MTQYVKGKRICKYGCGVELGDFDITQNKYKESDGTLHTFERCKSLKEKQAPKDHDLSVDVLLRRLDELGISIDLTKLRLVK